VADIREATRIVRDSPILRLAVELLEAQILIRCDLVDGAQTDSYEKFSRRHREKLVIWQWFAHVALEERAWTVRVKAVPSRARGAGLDAMYERPAADGSHEGPWPERRPLSEDMLSQPDCVEKPPDAKLLRDIIGRHSPWPCWPVPGRLWHDMGTWADSRAAWGP
jgi:hypothetical protein